MMKIYCLLEKPYENLTLQQKELVTNLFILQENELRITKMVTNTNLNIGDIVIFKGGNIYYGSESVYPANKKLKVDVRSRIVKKRYHPYHIVSLDGKGVYGWVDTKDLEKE